MYATGRGHVDTHAGEYMYDNCIYMYKFKHTLLLLISETFGGINDAALHYLRRLAKKAGKDGQDRTAYDTRRGRKLDLFTTRTMRANSRRQRSWATPSFSSKWLTRRDDGWRVSWR